MNTNFYQTLGIARNATPEEIKQAYRKLAFTHHPDRGGDAEKFKEIQIAYDTLSDPVKKQQYDNPQPEGQFFQFHHGGGMNEVFQHFFGGQGPFDFFGQRPQRNRTLNLQAEITFEESFYGKELFFNVVLPSGRNQTVNVKIPPGINDGTVLRLAGLGDDTVPNLPRGDIHFSVSVRPHPLFRRQGDDLIREISINCIDAMLGSKISVDTIDGKTIEVTINPGVQHGQILSAPGYGMPNVNDNRLKGRLLMPINIIIPNINDRQKVLLEQFNQLK